MQFWHNGRKYDTATITAEEKEQVAASVKEAIDEIVAMIAEFNSTSDLRVFSIKHFGRDGVHALYTDRNHVADRLGVMLKDLETSDRFKALVELGLKP